MGRPVCRRGQPKGLGRASAVGVISGDRIEPGPDVIGQIRVVDLGHDIDQPRICGRGDDLIWEALAQISVEPLFEDAGEVTRRQRDTAQDVHLCGKVQPELMAKAFLGVRAIPQLDHGQPLISPGEADEIEIGFPGRPARSAFRAIDLAPLHVHARDALSMPAGVLVKPVIVVPLRVPVQQGPALFPGGFRIALLKTVFAANVDFTAHDALDEPEIPPHDMAACGAIKSVMTALRVTMQEVEPRRLRSLDPRAVLTTATCRFRGAQRVQMMRCQRAANLAREHEMQAVADPAVDAKTLPVGKGMPFGLDGARMRGPVLDGDMAGSVGNVEWPIEMGDWQETRDRPALWLVIFGHAGCSCLCTGGTGRGDPAPARVIMG